MSPASTTGKPTIVLLSAANPMDDIRIFVKEARSLAKAGFSVTYIGRGDENDEVDGVRRIGVPRRRRGGRFVRMFVDPVLLTRKAWSERADYYQIHDPSLIPMALLFKLFGKRVGYDVHEEYRADTMSKAYLPVQVRPIVSKVFGFLEDFAVQRLDVVIAATPKIADTLRTDHTYVVTNFPITEEIRSDLTFIDRNPATVLYAGGIQYIRCIREMVEAIGIVGEAQSEARLVLLGEMPEEMRTSLEPLPGWALVEVLGFQSRSVVQEVMSTATCGLCLFYPEPNHVEAVPNKIFEYMAAGLPVVASNFPFWRQFVTDVGSGILVDPLSPNAIAGGILQILDDSARAREMGEAGLAAVRERFNWDSESDKLVAIIQGITRVASHADE